MAKNKDHDPNLNDQLQQHYAVNPRPDFLPQLKSDLLEHFPGQQPAQLRQHKIAFAMIAAVLVLVIVLFATPIGNALAQEVVDLFSRAESDVIPYPPAMTAIAGYTQTAVLGPTNTPAVKATKTPEFTRTPNPSSITDASMTIEEIEQAAGFDVLVPSQVPSIFKYTGGSYLPEENMTHLFYDLMGRSTNGLRISQEPVTGNDNCDLCSEIGPAANVQSVQIGDVPGELVIGVWIFEDGYKVWKNEQWQVRLRWQTNDTVFEIGFFGPPGTMNKSNMVHLAESMGSSNSPLANYSNTPTATLPDTTKTPDPVNIENANMTLEEVEQAAGFDILVPTYLPNLEFHGANFDPRTNIVYLFYQDGLRIRQESISGIADCDLCAEVRYGASYKYIRIGDIEAEYLFGFWMYTDQYNRRTVVPQPDQLRWQDNNTFFDIYYDHTPIVLSLDDLIQIAESFR